MKAAAPTAKVLVVGGASAFLAEDQDTSFRIEIDDPLLGKEVDLLRLEDAALDARPKVAHLPVESVERRPEGRVEEESTLKVQADEASEMP